MDVSGYAQPHSYASGIPELAMPRPIRARSAPHWTMHRTKPVRHATRRLRFLRSSPQVQRPHNGLPESLTRKRSTVPPLYPPADGVQFPTNEANCRTSAEIIQVFILKCRVDFKSGIFVESKSGMDFLNYALFPAFLAPSDCC